MKTCIDCLHYQVCADVMKQQLYIKEKVCGQKNPVCSQFTDRSEWVHLPDEEYTFTIRGDIANGIIIANCRAAEKALERMKMTNEIVKLSIGKHFTYEGIEWICLDIIDGNYLAITAKIWQELPFDIDNKNNWKESSLRRVLNDEFLDKLNKKHLVKQTSDLIAGNGDKAYGTSEDYVTILSCDQYRKYRDIVPFFDEWMWTLTPWTCGTSHSVHIVYDSNNVNSYGARVSTGVSPVCLFSSLAEIDNIKEGNQ